METCLSIWPKTPAGILYNSPLIHSLLSTGPNLHVRLGNLVWVIGGTIDCDGDVSSWAQVNPDLSIGRKSMIWSLKKQRWYLGPVLPGKNF